MADKEKERVNVHIPKKLKDWLKDYAERRNMTMSGVIKQVLFEEMENDKQFLKMDKKRQILNGIDDFVDYIMENGKTIENENELIDELKKYKNDEKSKK